MMTAGLLAGAGCAGREPAGIAVTTPADALLDCRGVAKEIGGNNHEMLSRARESLRVSAENASTVVKTFPFGLLMLMALDVKDAAGSELKVHGERSRLLEQLGRNLKCDAPHAYTVEEAMEIEAGERKRLPSAGFRVVEVGSGGDDPETPTTVDGQPRARDAGRITSREGSESGGASADNGPRKTTSLRGLMELFLRGDIDQREYNKRRLALPER